MENQPKKAEENKEVANKAKTKTNQYTTDEKKFADGEGTKLDKAIDAEDDTAKG